MPRGQKSETRQPGVRVAEAIEPHTHPVHEAQVEAAQLAVVVAGIQVVEGAAGLERAAQAAWDSVGASRMRDRKSFACC